MCRLPNDSEIWRGADEHWSVKLAYFNYYLMSFSDGNGVTVSTVGTH